MNADGIRLEMDLFSEVLEHPTEQRQAIIVARCGDAPDLADRLRKLLEGHARAEAAVATLGMASQVAEPMPTEIDSFRIVEKLGEGGMGVVYIAEQTQPVRRRVAIKLVKSGIDSAEVIARFHAERQALALMNHKNIAQILDAGVFEGRPYFVMELITGVPITEYCDRCALPIADRLRLFIEVCQGVQHAHQKGVIHRDLKPPNVLVTEEDGQPLPKIIDFGIAKAVDHRLTEHTMVTQHGHLIGTPAYMSPEQAGTNAFDIDTRCDVYSLGALLYELLTGRTPLRFESLDKMPLHEVMRVIREEEPMRPSRRLTAAVEGEGPLAGRLGTESRKLATVLRGELDWIVMKSLEKDRDRRYASVSDLAEDIQRHLTNQPVLAGPPSSTYRASKFVRRHKGLIVTGTLLLGSLIIGTTISTVQYFHAENERIRADHLREEAERAQHETALERDRAIAAERDADERLAEADAVTNYLSDMLASIDPAKRGREVSVRQVLDEASETIGERFRQQPLIAARLRHTIGNSYYALGLYDEAEQHLTTAARLHERILGEKDPRTLATMDSLANVLKEQGNHAGSWTMRRRNLELRRRVLGEEHPHTLVSMSNLANALQEQGKWDEAEEVQRKTLEIRRRVLGEEHPSVLNSMNNLAITLQNQVRWDEAAELYRNTLDIQRRIVGEEHPQTLATTNNLAIALNNQNKWDEAEELYRKTLVIQRRVFGKEHPKTLVAMSNLAASLQMQGKWDEAEQADRKTLEVRRRILGEEHPETLMTMNNLASALWKRGKLNEAEELARRAYRTLCRVSGERYRGTLYAKDTLAVILHRRGKLAESAALFDELINVRGIFDPHERGEVSLHYGQCLIALDRFADAEQQLLAAYAVWDPMKVMKHSVAQACIRSLASLYDAWGKSEEAAEWRAKLPPNGSNPGG